MNVLENRVVKIRKKQKCFGCAREFSPKAELQLIVDVDNGDFSRTYWCKTCREYWAKTMGFDDEILMGDLKAEDPEGWEEIRKRTEPKL